MGIDRLGITCAGDRRILYNPLTYLTGSIPVEVVFSNYQFEIRCETLFVT